MGAALFLGGYGGPLLPGPVWMAIKTGGLVVLLLWIGAKVRLTSTAEIFGLAWISCFAGAMLALVLASSLVLLFAAWEAVGVASWRLIAFHPREEQARQAAIKAFLMTRIGDLGFLLAWLYVLVATGHVDIQAFTTAIAAGSFSATSLVLLAVLFLIAAIGKSAQIPMSAWLPDATVAPTPVSALLHSATMVAAGVYLMLRLYPLFDSALFVLTALAWIGAASAVVAALAATREDHLKRILAWSTISQLGEMMMTLGLAGPVAATFHLVVHATYKSALFLTAGLVERSTGTRRLENMGGLAQTMPATAGLFVLAALSLAGFPLLSSY